MYPGDILVVGKITNDFAQKLNRYFTIKEDGKMKEVTDWYTDVLWTIGPEQ